MNSVKSNKENVLEWDFLNELRDRPSSDNTLGYNFLRSYNPGLPSLWAIACSFSAIMVIRLINFKATAVPVRGESE